MSRAAVKKDQRLTIAVVGTGSSALAGPDGPPSAYPARLEAALKQRLPAIAVKVVTLVRTRQTAEDLAKGMEKLLIDEKPDLVIWQSGTVDAMRRIEPEDFRAALEEGVETLQKGGADVILMNMQYSPRTEIMIALGPYADTMRVVAQQHEVPLFDRLASCATGPMSAPSISTPPARTMCSRTASTTASAAGSLRMIIDAAHLRGGRDSRPVNKATTRNSQQGRTGTDVIMHCQFRIALARPMSALSRQRATVRAAPGAAPAGARRRSRPPRRAAPSCMVRPTRPASIFRSRTRRAASRAASRSRSSRSAPRRPTARARARRRPPIRAGWRRSSRRRFPGHEITVLNRGVNGEEITDMLARLDTGVIAEQPDLVLWQVGTNSVLRDQAAAAARRDYCMRACCG